MTSRAMNCPDFENIPHMNTPSELSIKWCADPALADELARFFAANISADYISHSELQGPRALDIGKWRPGIVDIFAREIRERVSADVGACPVLEARREGRLVGIALVSFFVDAPVAYAILEDVSVDAASRNAGIGKAIIDWVVARARAQGCERMFLESGVNNHRAHELFERVGFEQVSVVLMKRLGGDAG